MNEEVLLKSDGNPFRKSSTKFLIFNIFVWENLAVRGGIITQTQLKNSIINLLSYSGNWDKDEDKFILDHVINKGRKWSSIVKLMGSQRTEHMIKNRFKSLLLKCQNKYTEPVPEEKLI